MRARWLGIGRIERRDSQAAIIEFDFQCTSSLGSSFAGDDHAFGAHHRVAAPEGFGVAKGLAHSVKGGQAFRKSRKALGGGCGQAQAEASKSLG